MVKLREASIEEAKWLSELALRSKAFWDYPSEFIEACREDLTIDEEYINKNHVYVLEMNGEVVGFFSFERGEVDRLDFLYIDPPFIGKGYGKVIWDHLAQKAKELGIKRFTIDSEPNAKGFYERMGAVQIGETTSTVFKNRSLPLMSYSLDQ